MAVPFIGAVRHEINHIIQQGAGRCLRCGSPAALVSYTSALQLFSSYVWRWPEKTPALYCENCGMMVPSGHFEAVTKRPGTQIQIRPGNDAKSASDQPSRCWFCSRVLESSFKHCPDCGAQQGDFARG